MTASSPRPGMRAVVTGGAGFLGSHLCVRLLARGLHVVCLDNLITGSAANLSHLTASPSFTLINCDITGLFGIDGEVEYVFHLASPASPADYLRFPVQTLNAGSIGTINALEVARNKQARFVLASSSEVYGDPLEHPQPESYWGNVNPIGPRSPYDEAKRFAEAIATAYSKTYSVSIAIARIFTSNGQQTRSICYVDDTIDGILALAGSSHPGPVNIGSDHEMTILKIATMIRDIAGSASPIQFIPRPADDPSVRRPDTTRARDLLGWEASVLPAEGLKRTIAWFADHMRSCSSGREPTDD